MKLSEAQRRILAFLTEQPGGGCRTNYLPADISAWAFRNCRRDKLLRERTGPSGFKLSLITPAGRSALEASDGR